MASKKKTTGKKINKTQFVLEHPKLSAKEVVDVAKKAGVTLSDKYVYNIRAKAKSKGGAPKGKPGRKPGRKPSSQSNGHIGDTESFINLALGMGLDKAEATLQRVREAIAKVV